MSGWDSVAQEGEDGREDGGCNSLHDITGGWGPGCDSLVREYGPISDDDGWNFGRGCPARGPERGGRYSRRRGGRECSRRGGRGRGRGREDWGPRCRMPGRGSPVREDWRPRYSVWAERWAQLEFPVRKNLERGGSGSPVRNYWAPEGWAQLESPVEKNLGWGGSGSPARENLGWGGSGSLGRGGSGSPAQEDGEESETSGSECPTSGNDDAPLSPEQEEEKSAGRNRTEQIQSLQSSLKSAFDDMQADLVRAERDNKGLTETNKKLKEELKRAKEGEESSKQNHEQTRNKLQKLVERTKILEEKQVELLKRIKEREKSSEKLEEELKRAEKGEESSKRDFEQTRNKLRELCTTFAAVKEECDKVCDQQGEAPQVAKKRKYVLKVLEVNDLLNCSICLEPWAQSGEHTVCSLSCGHFFGKSCITQWILKDEGRGSSTCPACLRRVTLSDIRHHYVSQIYEA